MNQNIFRSICITLILLTGISYISYSQQKIKPVIVEPGVSYELATYRHLIMSDIQYILDFDIPADRSASIDARENISFNLNTVTQFLEVDFKQGADHVKNILVNGVNAPVNLQEEHLLIAPRYLRKGINKLEINFIAGDASLNRNADFLYALFVPDRARTVFPCFDQPDLKAKFLLTLHVPAGWKVLANGVKKDSVVNGQRITYHFANSDKLPTYLFSFTAGKYTDLKQHIGNYTAEFLHRETDPVKIKLSVDSVFRAHQDAISFLEQWTNIPFPFQKVGFVGIPDFQFGGMEHPGEVQYKASALFLDDGATKDQLISRSNLISHEIAHMWFGDMVTMEWFNDVWMKEVFANFMADKVTEKLMGTETFNLKFLQDHYPAAYGVDRTMGANPIRQQLDNLQDAGSLYGNIIYHKAPIMMRQLELLMGKDNFQKGVREYLNKYAYSNATWNDLIAILSKYSSTDLYKWNEVWVNQPGRPVFDGIDLYKEGKFSSLKIIAFEQTGADRLWPQKFSITLFYPTYSKSIVVNQTTTYTEVKEAIGLPKPTFILYDSDGMGYGLFPVDMEVASHIHEIESPLARASFYINSYEEMLIERFFTPDKLLNFYVKSIVSERNEMNLRLLTTYITSIYWQFLSPDKRQAYSAELEQALWASMELQTLPNNKKILFNAYQSIYTSEAAKSRIYSIWKSQQAPAGIKLSEDDYTSLALSIALKSDTLTSVLKQQQDRITNVDRKNRLAFLIPALSLNVQERDAFFNSLADHKNRQKEAWVTTALSYLNHPLRQNTSVKYLSKSLELVEEIQRTGDVFFPQSWLAAVFGSYQSKEAYQVVTDFLKAHPNYNPKLKDKILQATDNIYRAQKMLSNN